MLVISKAFITETLTKCKVEKIVNNLLT